MDLVELQKKQEEALSVIAQFKNEHSEALKKNEEKSAELNQKLDKMVDAVAEVVELKNKIAALETMANGSKGSNNEDKEVKQKSEHFESFLKKGMSHACDFSDFCEAKSIDIKSMSVGSEPNGGYLVIPQFDTIRKTREFETSPIRQIANVISISGNQLDIPVDEDQATSGGWVGEVGARSESATPQVKKISIIAHEQYAMPYASQTILDDAGVNVEQWLGEKVADILGRTENTAFVSGNGVASPRGFLTYSAWASNGIYEYNKIEQVNSGSATTVTTGGLIDLQNSLKEYYQPRAKWLMKRSTFGAVMKLVDGTGAYLFNRALDMNVGKPFSLLGSSLMFADDMPALGANALSVAYGDFQSGYQIVDRLGVRVLRDPFSAKPYVIFYTTKRVGGGVVNFEAIKIGKCAA